MMYIVFSVLILLILHLLKIRESVLKKLVVQYCVAMRCYVELSCCSRVLANIYAEKIMINTKQ